MFEQHQQQHQETRYQVKQNRLYLQDIYAMLLFNEEKHSVQLKRVDLTHNWQDITAEDREVYRKLARNLIKEAAA